MGAISAIAGFFTGGNAAGPKLADDLFDKKDGHLAKVGAWFGNRTYTAEEEAENNMEMSKAVIAYSIATMEENTERSKGRREISVFLIKYYCIFAFLTWIVFPFNPEWTDAGLAIITSLGLAGAFVSATTFYFGSHAVSKFQSFRANKASK